ncbi:MAG: TIGR03000 domain-containing protein, partial [Planctomycetaceae bacterium]|nr:TIGR03000 domain-containing protein [Planctomycetaceae bacterium]
SGGSYSSHGSSGSSGSSGSYGSSGSSGSYGSSGSSGSYGSSGSSGGSYSSHGSSGSSGGHVVYSRPAVSTAAVAVAKPAVVAAPDRKTSTLVAKVPEDATVYLCGQKMTITGPERRYRIPIADPSREYDYQVRVEVVRDGKTLSSETTHKVAGGRTLEVSVTPAADSGELVAVASR